MSFWGPIIGAGIGAVGSLLGSRDQPETATTQTDNRNWSQFTPHPGAQPLYGMLAGGAGQMGQAPVPFFPGPTYVGPSMASMYGVNQGMNAVRNQMPGVIGMAGDIMGRHSTAADVANNPYVQAMHGQMRGDLTQNLMEDILPGVNAGANQVNAMGSGRHGLAQGTAVGKTQDAIQRGMTNLNLGAYNTGMQAEQSAMQYAPQQLQNMMAPSMAAQGLGRTVEGYQQSALQDAMARHMHPYMEPWQRMGNLQGILGAFQNIGTQQGYGQGTSTAPNPAYMNPWQAGIGGASLGWGVGNQLSNSGAFNGTATNTWYGAPRGNYATGGQSYTPSQYRTWM